MPIDSSFLLQCLKQCFRHEEQGQRSVKRAAFAKVWKLQAIRNFWKKLDGTDLRAAFPENIRRSVGSLAVGAANEIGAPVQCP